MAGHLYRPQLVVRRGGGHVVLLMIPAVSGGEECGEECGEPDGVMSH